jgi:UDP-3-O-[3-hydroxymyristoyl] glucosamine N-acyltransferase
MSRTVRELAALVRGRVTGDPDVPITAARPLGDAEEGQITFLDGDRHLQELAQSRASAFVVPEAMPAAGRSLIHVADPLAAFVTIYRVFHGLEEDRPTGIDPRAVIHPTAQIGPDVTIGPYACVGERTVIGRRGRLHAGVVVARHCQIGEDAILYPHAVLYDGTVLGKRVIVHAHAVLGADGFGYRFQDGRHIKVPQQGRVEIGDDVEIGACSTIDRGTFQATIVETGTKIDNLVMIGHNCRIGPHNLFVSQSGIAGSCTTGAYVVLAGQSGIADHLHLGDRAVIGAKAGVLRDVAAGVRVLGSPAAPEREQKRVFILLDKLPELHRDVKRIKRHLGMSDENNAA